MNSVVLNWSTFVYPTQELSDTSNEISCTSPIRTQHVWWLLDLPAVWACLAVWMLQHWCLNIPYWEPFRPLSSCGPQNGISALPSARDVGTTGSCLPSRATSVTAGGGTVSALNVHWSPRDSGSWPHRYGVRHLNLLITWVSLTF
jgi:hypothetical protein